MTERAGRHAASGDPAETLILPAEPWLLEDGAGPVVPLPRPAADSPATGRRASGRHAIPVADATGDRSAANGHRPAAAPSPDPAERSGVPGTEAGTEPAPERRQRAAGSASKLRLIWVYPDLLSTYGDRGNLLVLSRRARLRGIEVEAIEVNADQRVPGEGDIYLLGGGEDLPQILAASRLRNDGGLAAAAGAGRVVFAVCAGYQMVGHQFGGVEGEPVSGLGVLDITSGRGEQRGVGEVLADADPALGLPRLSGFENHQGVTSIGSGARPLAAVAHGVGNGDGTEGAYAGKVLGTYMHGPALARNPGLADLLLSWAVGPLPPIDPAEEEWAARLRAERLAAVPQ
jgi:lipid II isoglutaminyl synthase (glutamine-hydrolysing)